MSKNQKIRVLLSNNCDYLTLMFDKPKKKIPPQKLYTNLKKQLTIILNFNSIFSIFLYKCTIQNFKK